MNELKPSEHQAEIPIDRLIVREAPDEDSLPVDVVFVGGGPAGLAGAIELARLVKKDAEEGGSLGDLEIGVLEKAARLGDHCLSGAVVNPIAFRELFPELDDEDFPFRTEVEKDKIYFLTNEDYFWLKDGEFVQKKGTYNRIPTPPTMMNHGNYVASICELVRWLGEQAEELGVNLFTRYPADSLLVEGDRVVGVRTTPTGLDREGKPGGGYVPPTDVTAQVTVLAEGTRGPLTQAYLEWQNLRSANPQIYALGVKEVWQVKKAHDAVIHTMGWPVPTDCFGGSFFYPMGDDLVALGLVIGLDYPEHAFDIHGLLQQLKKHPLFRQYLEGGEMVEWGAKTIPEGGYYAVPERLHGDGLLMTGDAVGFVNVPALKGIHYAMKSGICAARAVFEALKKGDTSAAGLSTYDELVKDSYIWRDLYETRNMRLGFKNGFYVGGALASLATVTKGMIPPGRIDFESDADHEKVVSQPTTFEVEKGLTMSKVDAVFFSGNATRDDIPSHLILEKDVPPQVAQLYEAMCPAAVYEVVDGELVVNPSNCIDCKTTDVLGPRWLPREGGAGTKYNKM